MSSTSIEYNGHILTPATRFRRKTQNWTLEVQISPVGRVSGARRCRAPNMYATKEKAMGRCLEFGRRIVDGKMVPKAR